MKKIAAIILTILALAMIVMGIGNFLIPPVLTGIGFLFIAFVFFRESRLNQFEQ